MLAVFTILLTSPISHTTLTSAIYETYRPAPRIHNSGSQPNRQWSSKAEARSMQLMSLPMSGLPCKQVPDCGYLLLRLLTVHFRNLGNTHAAD